MQTAANVKFNSFLYYVVMEKMEKHLQKKMAEEDIHTLLEVDTVRFLPQFGVLLPCVFQHQ